MLVMFALKSQKDKRKNKMQCKVFRVSMNRASSLRATAAFMTLHKPADFDQLFSMMLVPSNPGLWALAKGQGVWHDKRFVIKLMPLKSCRLESKQPIRLKLKTCGHWNLRQQCRGQSGGWPALHRHTEVLSFIEIQFAMNVPIKNESKPMHSITLIKARRTHAVDPLKAELM